MKGLLSIGEIAQEAGLSTSAIRYYESMGLLPAPQRQSGQRRFEPDTLKTLGFIKLAQQAGFSILEIQTLLLGFPSETPPSARWRALAEQKLEALALQLERLQAMQRTLEAGLKCACISIETCDAACG